MNKAALEYWKLTGYCTQDLNDICPKMDHILSLRCQIFKHRTINIALSNAVVDKRQGHFGTCIKLLGLFFGKENATWEGELFFWLEDMIWTTEFSSRIPIFSFSRLHNDFFSLLMPDPAFVGTCGYTEELAEIHKEKEGRPWKERKPIAFWRGTNTGMSQLIDDQWKTAPRAKLVLMAQRPELRERVDAFFSKAYNYPNNRAGLEIENLDLLREPEPFINFLRYRYLIDVDGESCAWKSLFLKLASGSVVLKVGSPHVQWYYDRLIPWVHYVPIKEDLSDLMEIIDWVNNHDDACQQIANTAGKLITTLNFQNVLNETESYFKEILGYRR